MAPPIEPDVLRLPSRVYAHANHHVVSQGRHGHRIPDTFSSEQRQCVCDPAPRRPVERGLVEYLDLLSPSPPTREQIAGVGYRDRASGRWQDWCRALDKSVGVKPQQAAGEFELVGSGCDYREVRKVQISGNSTTSSIFRR